MKVGGCPASQATTNLHNPSFTILDPLFSPHNIQIHLLMHNDVFKNSNKNLIPHADAQTLCEMSTCDKNNIKRQKK